MYFVQALLFFVFDDLGGFVERVVFESGERETGRAREDRAAPKPKRVRASDFVRKLLCKNELGGRYKVGKRKRKEGKFKRRCRFRRREASWHL